jgi:polysaccharide biosynthesis/export protein
MNLGRVKLILALAGVLGFAACTSNLPVPPASVETAASSDVDYKIGPLDTLQVYVRNEPDLSVTIPVRPDGRISTPLIQDMVAAGKTASQLSQDIADELRSYIQDPIVTVMVSNFSGPFDQQVRVVGEATDPRAIPYRANMTLLDVMIEVGGLTEFADGNRAVLVRGSGQQQQSFSAHLDDLLKDGDISANAPVLPGDVIIIPQSWF